MKLLDQTLKKIIPADVDKRLDARKRLEQLTMPHWALGRLMDLAEDLAGMTGSTCPPVKRKVIVTMAADHGVVAEGVSAYPQEVTAQMARNIAAGRAGINALACQAGAEVVIVDLGVATEIADLAAAGKIVSRRIAAGTRNMADGAAMSRDQAICALETGIEMATSLAPDVDIFGTGEMGIGNTTPSSALVSVFCGCPAKEATGQGTGIDADQLLHKIAVIERSIAVNRPDKNDGLDIVAKVGGFEIAGIAGLILGAASLRKPVVVDGFISTAGALVAQSLSPVSTQYMIASHRSIEKGHQIALAHLDKKPLLDLDLRLGEGTGAALAMNFVEAAARILTEVATFAEARVSKSS